MLVKNKFIFSFLFTLLLGIAIAWSDEDLEIFALREEVEKDLGKGTTFYDWLDVPQNAKDEQIAKAYRRLSRQLHPDKNAHHTATEKYARLSLVVNVLRSELRERYDFFLSKGFPMWKGTDYYYNRYRPGLGTVLIFLYVFISCGQYLLLKIGTDRDRSHMRSIIDEARRLAWSGSSVATANVKAKKRVTLSNGKSFTVYADGNVFLVEQEVEYLLDLDEIKHPRWKDTILFKVPLWCMGLIKGEKSGSIDKVAVEDSAASESLPPKKKRTSPRPATKVAGRRK